MESLTQFLSSLLSLQDGNISLSRAIGAIFIAYLGGILSSLTPCVYPMIPITVSVVGGIGENRLSWREVTIRGLAYVTGMAVVYSVLGVLAGVTGKVFGTFTNTRAWYLSLGLIMTVAALIMLDILPFDPAVTWETWKRKFRHRRGRLPSPRVQPKIQKEMTHLGAFTLGASSGFIAAPCTTPVLTSILAFIAKTQSVGLGFFLMLSFSLGLGTLLMVIAVFAGAVEILPRSGKWMKVVKAASGLILLAFAEYLIYRAGTIGGL
jgi:thiol:disulfide interchange protein DsbD